MSNPLLPESEEVLRSAGISTWRWDAVTGVFTLSEDGVALLKPRDDELPLTLETISEHLEVDDVEAFVRTLGNFSELGGIHEAEFRAHLDDGQIRWFRSVGKAHLDDGGTISHATGILMDVTDLRRAQESHRAFFEQPNGLHLIASLAGTIIDINAAWTSMLGHDPESLRDSSFLRLVHPEDQQATIREMERLAEGHTTQHFENRCRHSDGSYRLLAWSAAVPESDPNIYAVGIDITQQRESAKKLVQAAAVFDHSGEGILVSDNAGNIREVNGAFTRITGYSHDEAVGQHTRLLRSGRHDAAFYDAMWRSIERQGSWRGEIWNRRKSGEIYPELLTITRIEGADGGYVAIFTDISKIKETELQLQELAHYDQLTRLPNRHLINERLEQGLLRARRRRTHLAVIFLDIDSFKHINDSLGHAAGDSLLVTTAKRLKETLRDEDNVGRIGGDEFLIIMEDISSSDDSTIVAEKIIGALRQPIALNGRSISVSASLGISLYPEDGQTAEALMSNADAAMYSAKEQGRDTFRFYSERLTKQALQNVLFDSALREAQKHNELRLAFQLQKDLRSGDIIGLEVLLRWHHPKLGTVPPGQFIPHAERTGLIRSIGRWVLEQSCLQGARWLADGLHFGRIAVNVSPPQFRDDGFVDSVHQALKASGLPPEHLELEITEGLLVRDTDEVIEKMAELRALGIGFAIDDFGTGYSSLAYLQRMPLDRLKLDQSFVRDVEVEGTNRIIANAVIALGRALGLRVIAEGVESLTQEATIRHLGCDEAQGYLYGVPISAQGMTPLLRHHGPGHKRSRRE